MVSNSQVVLKTKCFDENNKSVASVVIGSCLLTLYNFMTEVLYPFRIQLSSSSKSPTLQGLIIKSKRFVFPGGFTFIRDIL